MINNIDFLLNKPEISKHLKLIIQPLAPLSMVSEIPGSYYKTLDTPDKFKISGLLENILGWHFSKNDRGKIIKHIKKKSARKKDYVPQPSNSGFQCLLVDYFEIGMVFKQPSVQYNDYWKRSFTRLDSGAGPAHPNGTPNLDYSIIKEKHTFLKNGNISDFFEKRKRSYPMFYTTPTPREYIDYEGGEMHISIHMDPKLFDQLKNALLENSTAYLGNSEGWVDIKIEEI
ncbi:type I-PGING CRISPR-associated protein Cas5p [Cruoricaptor ignavus]|uniref:Type I-PGING CRISPR-associated protein Cas5p n=1 Tax=Cruoricaptor ignavus TaxID=1118202 RepID=A0A7M1T205_9FLAO|nr:type I-PGING CRISPR-associated protein Cas5p [Cruoricaptor ignavus]QOR73287.1 type I-PGING CRISPR-associated protein Cas5p [Cruoricaptor ignavus]